MPDWNFLVKKYIGRNPHPYHEPELRHFLSHARGKLFVDVGCAWKPYARLLNQNFENIITIDPNPKWNADIQIALADYDAEKVRFYIRNNDGSADSLIREPYIQGKQWMNTPQIVVSVRTWDSLKLDADLVKIDVEGAEFMVLRGMMKYLPKSLVIELHDETREQELIKASLEKGYSRAEKVDANHWWFHSLAETSQETNHKLSR